MDELTKKTPKLNVVFTGVNRVYRLVIHVGIFDPAIAPLTFSLVHPPPPLSQKSTYSLYRQCVWLGGVGVFSCVGDHILQKLSVVI
jgi:hypothetical protein